MDELRTLRLQTVKSTEGFSLVTGPGRTPMSRRQANALGRVLGTVPQTVSRH